MASKRKQIVACWERQPKESWQAFEGFVTYRDLGPERSLAEVRKKLHKSATIFARWSRQYEWVKRCHAYDDHLDAIKRTARESAIAKKARHVMTSFEVLEGMSAHGQGDITDLLDEKGEFDLVEIKRRGLGGLIKSITYHANGKVARVELYDAKDAKDIMGRYYKLWDRGDRPIDDPEAVLAQLLGVKRSQLPPADFTDAEFEVIPDSSFASKDAVAENEDDQSESQ